MRVRGSLLVTAAREVAQELLGGMGDRWRHTCGVAARADELAYALDLDPDVLVSSAWLHDIGYATPALVTGFHPLDGADHLAGRGWPLSIAARVAHHSGARFVAAARGLGELLSAYPYEEGPMSDALTYADQTVGPRGDRVSPAARHDEMLLRHGPSSWNARVDHLRGPYLLEVADRVERCLAAHPAGTPA
ncbi:metal-dependent phosphohydrolase, HD subdomain protein [Actinoplanes sp. NBRC 14428]|uniref:HD domain-containing protein n=1 Tax=Pseudosporangium ferrugineum TaxID=439699 RepID=A0A2T0SHX5_9ACTN|nr:HD domain-containing protein [Pseudosporangium ferrugineum]PRY32963.1 HD domain-containing protein [Pseudosporangium ferrugineum]BCJ49070.1 metal-dependent phosphohydrolase, HD subdomain protein [Actinoplanes sp. NBRC 14428]